MPKSIIWAVDTVVVTGSGGGDNGGGGDGGGGDDSGGGGNDWQWWRLMLTVMGNICDTCTATNLYVLSCSL